jgi:predicted metalloprotease
MKWQGRRRSSNVQDARGRRVSGGGGAGIGTIINVVLRLFGVKGIAVLAVLGIIGWQMGLIDPVALMGGEQVQEVEFEATPEEEERFQFVSVVLADNEDIWTREFTRLGRAYAEPELIVFRDRVQTSCGTGDARMGPWAIKISISTSASTTIWRASLKRPEISPRPTSSRMK